MDKHALRASAGHGLVRTDDVITPRKLRELLAYGPREALGSDPIPTHDGEWRLDPNGQWRFWEFAEAVVERAEAVHA
jgi:hypothetical protein